MRLCTVKTNGEETAAVVTKKGVVLIKAVNSALNFNWSTNLFDLINSGQLEEMNNWYRNGGSGILEELAYIPADEVEYGPLYRNPRKIWGIGLNYVEHAADLSEKAPNTEPASFMKPDTTIIGPNDTILIPHQSERTTAEAELGVIIGKVCKDVN